MTPTRTDDLLLESRHGNWLRFPAIWLRDNCPCTECRDARTGQKLMGVTDLSEALSVARFSMGSDTVTVVYAPDEHRSVFARSWLEAHALEGQSARNSRTEDAKQLWRAANLAGRMPAASWSDYLEDTDTRIRSLESVLRLGFAILHGVPREAEMVVRVAETFGYVRETNYGRLFDVQVKVHPNNLAFTGLPITPHTDNPYRDPVPTLQLLHCLTNAAAGGDSGLVDGFQAAALLREQEPRAFAMLCARRCRLPSATQTPSFARCGR